jgi:hypothetical protein
MGFGNFFITSTGSVFASIGQSKDIIPTQVGNSLGRFVLSVHPHTGGELSSIFIGDRRELVPGIHAFFYSDRKNSHQVRIDHVPDFGRDTPSLSISITFHR